MNMDIYSATPPVAKKRRKYSKEFKLSIVNACKNPLCTRQKKITH